MRVLITGANGMVARAAAEHCSTSGDNVIALTRQELDISDRPAVLEALRREKPDTVLNCAAYTDVDGAETDREKCRAVNALGVENLALASKEIGSAFVTISTDYVFDGTLPGFYSQRDTPNPQSIYANTKLAGERLAAQTYARTIIVRSGWIFGSGGTNFLSVMDRILAEGKKISAISDAFGTPTFAGDLASRLRELAVLDLPAIYHITNSGDGASYEDFAREVCAFKGYDPKLLEVVSQKSLKRPAPRPDNSRLACLFSEKFGLAPMPRWDDSLAKFLDQ